MDINGWKYYNHAMIPSCHPYEEADIAPLKDGRLWKHPAKPLLARWTTDFDCGYETNWWYIIKDAPFDTEALSSKTRKHIRQALSKVRVEKIAQPDAYAEDIYRVYTEAFGRYKNAAVDITPYECFVGGGLAAENVAYWCAFEIETGRMIGYMKCIEYPRYVELSVSKFSTDYMKLRASDALHSVMLDFYLNQEAKEFVNSGSRVVNHDTNVQDYKIDTFGFRRAYCKLNIAYRPIIRWMIPIAYFFRKLLKKLDGIRAVHMVNSVIKMEEIRKGK